MADKSNRQDMYLPKFLLFVALCFTGWPTISMAQASMERIVVAPNQPGFVTAQSKQPFHPWGFNYGHHGGLMEDFWNTNWPALTDDFQKMRALGANVARVHLQYGKFMSSPDQPNPEAFKQLSRLLQLAEKNGIYLDVTGLACYRPADTPKWYDDLDEPQRWAAQSNFWNTVAATCAHSPSVFCYDLINEPVVPGDKRKSGAWPSGQLFGDYDFVQFVALDPAGRPREAIAKAWIQVMTSAIHKHDTNTLITVGLLPWSSTWGFLSGFVPKEIAPDLDFISVHIYPDSQHPEEALETLRRCAVGKPVVIEETFPLSCNFAEEQTFLVKSKKIACGWLGHFDGYSLADYDQLADENKLSPPQAIYRDWERMFVKLKPEFAPHQKTSGRWHSSPRR